MNRPLPHGESPSRDEDLIERYFAGLLDEAELADLDRLLIADSSAAASFAGVAREQQRLAAHFRLLRDTAVVDEMLRTAQAAATIPTGPEVSPSLHPSASPSSVTRPLRHSVSLRHPLFAAALVLAMLGGGLVWFTTRNPVDPTAGVPQSKIVAGTISYGGGPAAPAGGASIRNGVPFEVAGASPAVLRLGDGSQAELAPATRAELRGDARAPFEAVVLERGSARFRVDGATVDDRTDPFRVETPVGSVTARGTEFTVEVRPADALLLAPPQLLVAVLAGEVSVDYGSHTYTLGLGDDRIYAAGDSVPSAPADVVGRVASVVHADDGETTTINVEVRRSPSKKGIMQKIRLTTDTRLAWVNVPVDRQVPRVGYTASIWRDPANFATAAAVRFEAPPDAGPPPQLSGSVVEVAPDGRSIVLELPAHVLKHLPSRRRTISIDKSTAVNYFFLPPSAQLPTVGYRATVRLADGFDDRARVVNFSGDKRSDYKPDLAGLVDGLSNDARQWKLTVKEKIPGKGVRVTSRVVRITPDTKIVYDGDPTPTPLGHEAAVWLSEGSPETAAGIRITPRFTEKVAK